MYADSWLYKLSDLLVLGEWLNLRAILVLTEATRPLIHGGYGAALSASRSPGLTDSSRRTDNDVLTVHDPQAACVVRGGNSCPR